MNRPEELIKKIYEEQGQINDVIFYSMWRFFSRSLSRILFYQCRIRNYALSLAYSKRVDCIPIQISEKGCTCNSLLSWW